MTKQCAGVNPICVLQSSHAINQRLRHHVQASKVVDIIGRVDNQRSQLLAVESVDLAPLSSGRKIQYILQEHLGVLLRHWSWLGPYRQCCQLPCVCVCFPKLTLFLRALDTTEKIAEQSQDLASRH